MFKTVSKLNIRMLPTRPKFKTDTKNNKDDKACTKKYFIVHSTRLRPPPISKGITLIKLISSPSHAPSHVDAETLKREDTTITIKNIKFEGINIIRIRI
jgi:hypothetical protein